MSENPGVPAFFGGYNLPLLVEIELTDLSKWRGGISMQLFSADTTILIEKE